MLPREALRLVVSKMTPRPPDPGSRHSRLPSSCGHDVLGLAEDQQTSLDQRWLSAWCRSLYWRSWHCGPVLVVSPTLQGLKRQLRLVAIVAIVAVAVALLRNGPNRDELAYSPVRLQKRGRHSPHLRRAFSCQRRSIAVRWPAWAHLSALPTVQRTNNNQQTLHRNRCS